MALTRTQERLSSGRAPAGISEGALLVLECQDLLFAIELETALFEVKGNGDLTDLAALRGAAVKLQEQLNVTLKHNGKDPR